MNDPVGSARTASRPSPPPGAKGSHGTPAGARRRRRLVESLEGWAFVSPGFLILMGLSIFPAGWALVLSFQKWNGFSAPKMVGVDNYRRLVTDSEFGDAVAHTALFVVMFVPASVFLGFVLAIALNRKIRFIGLYRTAIFAPFVVSAASTGILANYLFSPQYGVVNNVLRQVGIPAQGWLEDPNQAMVVIALMSLWGQAAFTTVLYLAGLQDVPTDLLEAARIDGASGFQTVRLIIWPLLRPVTVFVVIWQTITALQLFDLVYVTTKGGPLDATKTIVYFLWERAFKIHQIGYGSAAAYVLFVVTLGIALGMVLYSRRKNLEAF